MKKFTLLLSAMLLACATNLWAETVTYQHVFNAKPSTGNNIELTDVSWNITAIALNNYNSKNYAGVQFGTSSANGSITLTSPSNWNYNGKTKITEVRLWLNLGGTSVTPSVTIGGKAATSDGTKVVKNSKAGNDWTKATKVTFTPAADGNTGVVVINVTSEKAGYICAMEIDSESDNNTNPVLTCAESVAFGNISSLVGTAPSKTLEVTAKNLTEDINVTLSADAAFTLSTTTLPAEGGSIEITPVLTVGENTATLKLTSGEKSATVTLTATIQQAYTISWSVNGKVTSTSAVIKGENLVLPASPEAPNDCASKVFVGWATTATVAADGTDIVFVDASTTATADATYYAVFATATESGETVTKYEKLTSTEDFEDGTYLLVGCKASTTYYAYTGKVTDKKFAGVAEVTVANDVISKKPETALELTITTNAEGKFSIYDGTYWLSAPNSNDLTFNTTNTIDWSLTDNLKIQSVGETSRYLQFNAQASRFACYTGSMSDPYLFKKVVTSVMAYSDYATTCDDTPSAIESATAETPAVKTIENGQLIILRDGVKYNAMGVRLQ